MSSENTKEIKPTSESTGVYSEGHVIAGRDIINKIYNNPARVSGTKELQKAFAFQVPEPPLGFEQRAAVLEKIRTLTLNNKLSNGIITSASCTTVISGCPGTGKTTLAQLFIKKYGKDFPYQVWITAETVNAIRDQFIDLGENQLNIYFLENEVISNKKIADRVYSQLSKSPTLIVFDNAESATDEFGLKEGIADFLPPHIHQSFYQPIILVTTRIKAAEAWTTHPSRILELTGFSEAECSNYLTTHLPLLKSFQRECHALAEYFHRLPVAISTLTTIMKREAKNHPGNYSPRKLVQRLTSGHATMKLDGSGKDVYSKLNNLWDDLLKKLQKVPEFGEKAIRLLHVLSVLSSTGIPLQFLSAIIPSYLGEKITKTGLLQLLRLLQKFSFININDTKDLVSIHVLLQSYLRSTLVRSDEISCILESCAGFLIEAKHVISFKTQYYPQNFKNFAIFCGYCIKYLTYNENLKLKLVDKIAPYQPLEAIHQIKQMADGIGGSNSLKIHMGNISATCYSKIGHYRKSLENYQQVYNLRLQILGEKHYSTLNTKHNMAGCYSDLGKKEKALEMFQQVYEAQVEILGKYHPHTLTAKNNMAICYSDLGKNEKALEMFHQVHVAQVQIRGENHYSTLNTKHNMASCYSALRKKEIALKMHQQVYKARVQILGEYHPHTLTTKNNMAICYSKLGEKVRALEMFQQVYVAQVQTQGEYHPDTLTTKNNMAGCYSSLRKKEKALDMYQQVYDARVQILGEYHRDTLQTKHSIKLANRQCSIL